MIPVSDFISSAFAKADPGTKRKVEIYINAWLNDFFKSKSANEQLFDLMKKATLKAKSKGFTEDKLDDLLK